MAKFMSTQIVWKVESWFEELLIIRTIAQVNTVAFDALAPCDAKASAAMVFAMFWNGVGDTKIDPNHDFILKMAFNF